jgi:hypothetical protein
LRELHEHEVGSIAHRLRLEDDRLLRGRIAGDAEVEHLDLLAGREAAAVQLDRQLPPPGAAQRQADGLRIRVAEDSDAVHALPLVDVVVHVVLALGVQPDEQRSLVAVRIGAQRPAEREIGVVPDRRAELRHAQARLGADEERRGSRRRGR